MEQYISKSALVAEIEKIRKALNLNLRHDQGVCDGLYAIQKYINTLEVKEVDLDTEIIKWEESFGHCPASMGYKETAKHFFELGLNASNPITEINLELFVRQVIDLYLEAGKHYNIVIKEERKEYGGSDLAIKLLDGVIDAKELSIQYALDKLKAQKGE